MLSTGIALSTPIALSALGETVAERTGVLNIGIEGVMLTGALAAYAGVLFTGSLIAGLFLAMFVGGLVALLHAFLTVTVKMDQIVTGIGVILASLGITTFLFSSLAAQVGRVSINGLFDIPVPLLSQIPIVGPIIFNHNALVYLGFILAPILYFVLFKTGFGIMVTAVGEYPLAAHSAAINVERIRYVGVVVGGLLAGLGGALLSLTLGFFVENMVQGRGFIAVAAVILGGWKPHKVYLASLLFGTVDSVQLRLQALGFAIPYPFLLMLPYLLAVITLVVLRGKAKAPRMLTIPFDRPDSVKRKGRRLFGRGN